MVAVIAIILSLGALAVSVLEVSSIRSEQRIGVWPYVDLSQNYNEEGFSINATNKGIGPARVRSIKMTLDGETIETLDEMIIALVGPDLAFSYDVYKSYDPSNSVLSADERAILFAVPWTDATRALVEGIDRFSVSLCYCSVYDDCWQAKLGQGDPDEVSECPEA